jgi:tRNA(Ile2) C34 agmatinyltransferase TiaS
MSAGKGDTPRPVNWEKYGNNYDEIFRKKPTCQKCGNPMENNYIYGLECEKCDNGKDNYHDR